MPLPAWAAPGRLVLCRVRSHGPRGRQRYTYAYTRLGEIFAWIIGWDLILEYAMGSATVASAWTSYLNKLLAAIEAPPGSRGIVQRPLQRRESSICPRS